MLLWSSSAVAYQVVEVPCNGPSDDCDAQTLWDLLYNDEGNPRQAMEFVLGTGTWHLDFHVSLNNSRLVGSTEIAIDYESGCEYDGQQNFDPSGCYTVSNETILDFTGFVADGVNGFVGGRRGAVELLGHAEVEGVVVQANRDDTSVNPWATYGVGIEHAGTRTRARGNVIRGFGSGINCRPHRDREVIDCLVEDSVLIDNGISMWTANVDKDGLCYGDTLRRVTWSGNLVFKWVGQGGATLNITSGYCESGNQSTTWMNNNVFVGSNAFICNAWTPLGMDNESQSQTVISNGDRFVGRADIGSNGEPLPVAALVPIYADVSASHLTGIDCHVEMTGAIFENNDANLFVQGNQYSFETRPDGSPVQVRDNSLTFQFIGGNGCNGAGSLQVQSFDQDASAGILPDGVNREPLEIELSCKN